MHFEPNTYEQGSETVSQCVHVGQETAAKLSGRAGKKITSGWSLSEEKYFDLVVFSFRKIRLIMQISSQNLNESVRVSFPRSLEAYNKLGQMLTPM